MDLIILFKFTFDVSNEYLRSGTGSFVIVLKLPLRSTVTTSPAANSISGLKRIVLLFFAKIILPVCFPLLVPVTVSFSLIPSATIASPYLIIILVAVLFNVELGTGERY